MSRSHIPTTPFSLFFIRWEKKEKTLRGVGGNLKMFTSILQALRSPHRSCISSLSVVKIYHRCAPLLFLLLLLYPGERGWYLCQMVWSSVCNSKLTGGEERKETLLRREKLSTRSLQNTSHKTRSLHVLRGALTGLDCAEPRTTQARLIQWCCNVELLRKRSKHNGCPKDLCF